MDHDLKTEEGRIAAAKEAGRNVAGLEYWSGYTEPRDWDRDGVHNAGAFSHLVAVGFSRLGTRMFSQTFVDAYREEFERLMKDGNDEEQRYYWDEPDDGDDPNKPYGDDTARIIDTESGVIAYAHKLNAPVLVRTLNENPLPLL